MIFTSQYLKMISIFVILFLFTAPNHAQWNSFCHWTAVHKIAWSPDGEQLAVTTARGLLIYDADLNLVREIGVPILIPDPPRIPPTWSLDKQWIILANHIPLDIITTASDNRTWSLANAQTGEVRQMVSFDFDIAEIVWSPDNQHILGVSYESVFGTYNPPFSKLRRINGVSDTASSPTVVIYDDIHLYDLQWDVQDVITAQHGDVRISFNSELELIDTAPIFAPRRWLASPDGKYDVSFREDQMLLMRQIDGESEFVDYSDIMNTNDVAIQPPSNIQLFWASNSQYVIGVYPIQTQLEEDHHRIIQGTVIDATTATEIRHFIVTLTDNIQSYYVSPRGDRIVVLTESNVKNIEVWNPLTDELINSVEIPLIPLPDICED